MTKPEPTERALALIPPSTPTRLDEHDQAQLELLRRMVNADLNDDEFEFFVRAAVHSGLDPFRRQIYGIKRQGKLTIQTGIDGYRAIAQRSGVYAGSDDATFEGRSMDKQYPGKATVTVWKIVGGIRVPFTGSARWDEYKPAPGNSGNGDRMWKAMPFNQLAKCAEALALRKAFPEELSGIVAEEAVIDIDYVERSVAPGGEPSREQAQGDRWRSLPIEAKIEFTAWVGERGFVKPYSDEQLDEIEAKLDALEGITPEAPDVLAGDEPVARTCAHCDAAAIIVDDDVPYCAEHIPPEVEA
jgi:phage recombination protein Bet